jgi:hypothetical protein
MLSLQKAWRLQQTAKAKEVVEKINDIMIEIFIIHYLKFFCLVLW